MKIQISRSNLLVLEMVEYAITHLLKCEHRIVEVNLKASLIGELTNAYEKKVDVSGRVLIESQERQPADSEFRLTETQEIPFTGTMTIGLDKQSYEWNPRWMTFALKSSGGTTTTNHPCGFDGEDTVRRKIAFLRT